MYNFLFKSRYTVGVKASFIGVPETPGSVPIPADRNKATRQLGDSPGASPTGSFTNSYGSSETYGSHSSPIRDRQQRDEISEALMKKVH